jgi:pimeloyl-ACP methyl ester carboxylesterase
MHSRRFSLCILLIALASGCASLPNTVTEQVDHRQVEYLMVRHDTIPVIFENGLDGKMDWWAKVIPEISQDTTVFVYNRPGYGKSEPISTPRDGTHIVEELRSVLCEKGLNPPYVLVGHSVGGLYVQLFARRHTEEIAGLVLVDSTHPAQFIGKGSVENWPAWFRWLFDTAVSSVAKQEFGAINATGESLLALPPLVNRPVIVLSAQKPMKETSELAIYANEKRQQIALLNPGSKQVWVDSGHGIPLEKPEAVVSAIREVLTAVYAQIAREPNVRSSLPIPSFRPSPPD